jgi:PadR family transcriptional regulator, regulatory protein AphA
MELSKTSYVILGMLALGKRTGYEIKSLVDVSTRNFWAASYGQIYPELKRLEDAGLIAGKDEPGDGRRRRAFELTADGAQALRDWLTSDDPLHLELRHEGALKLFFSDVLDVDERIEQVRRMRAEHGRIRERLMALREVKQEVDQDSMTMVVLRWGIAYQDFMIEWTEQAERELSARKVGA